MAPKRTSTGQAPHAKKAKTRAPEAPLLDFIGKCDDVPKPCREMLQVAVPICLEVVEADRHKFQVEILDRVSGLIAGVDHKKREALRASEAELAAIQADKDKAAADHNTKKAAADAKQAECDAKGKVVDAAREVLNGANGNLATVQKAQSDFLANKAALIAEQENFEKLMTEVYHPLKDNTIGGNWRSKQKVISELQKKLSDLGAQESLSDALATTLKMTPDKREGTFAKATMQFAEDYFNKHKAKVASDIEGLGTQEATHADAITANEATVAEKKAALDVVDKEWDEMQTVWVGLDKLSAEAARAEKQLDNQMPRAQKTIDKATADLNKFLEVPALFASLKEKSTAAAEEPEEPEEEKQDAEEENAAEGEKPEEAEA